MCFTRKVFVCFFLNSLNYLKLVIVVMETTVYLIAWSPVFSGPLETSPRSTRGPEAPWVRWSHPQTRAEGNQRCARCWSPDRTAAVSIRLRVHTERPWLHRAPLTLRSSQIRSFPRRERQSSRPRALCVTYIDRRSIKWRQAKAERRPLFNMSQRKGGWKGSVTKLSELSSKHHFWPVMPPKCVRSVSR